VAMNFVYKSSLGISNIELHSVRTCRVRPSTVVSLKWGGGAHYFCASLLLRGRQGYPKVAGGWVYLGRVKCIGAQKMCSGAGVEPEGAGLRSCETSCRMRSS
jgi:hypothetical protein